MCNKSKVVLTFYVQIGKMFNCVNLVLKVTVRSVITCEYSCQGEITDVCPLRVQSLCHVASETVFNWMVSAGDTEISLHIRPGQFQFPTQGGRG